MTKKIRQLILYPIIGDILSEKQKVYIFKALDITPDSLIDILEENVNLDNLKNIIEDLDSSKRVECFKISKEIIELETPSLSQLKKLAELGELLEISEKETGFNFNLYDEYEIINFEFNKALINFSMIGASIAFIPFIPIADYFILTTLQVALISKIFTLYNFELNPKEFLKIITFTLGSGFIFKMVSKILTGFVPILGWFVKASVAFSGTYAIGILAKSYALAKGDLSSENIKEIWKKASEDGKKEFDKLKKVIIEQKDNLLSKLKNYKTEL